MKSKTGLRVKLQIKMIDKIKNGQTTERNTGFQKPNIYTFALICLKSFFSMSFLDDIPKTSLSMKCVAPS